MPHITSLGRNPNSKSQVWFLLMSIAFESSENQVCLIYQYATILYTYNAPIKKLSTHKKDHFMSGSITQW